MAKKKRLVVIGGSSGIGLEIAKMMYGLGYEVDIASRSKEKLEKALKEIGKVAIHTLDITVEKEITQFFSEIGSFDHLITTAAEFFMGSFLNGKTQDARNYLDSKFWGQYCAAKYGAPKIREGGSIIFFSGAANQRPILNFSAGCAINAAVEGLARALALELSPIRVNAISPGIIVSPLWDPIPEADRSALFSETAKQLPAKRIGRPVDIATAARFLIECDYVTGEVVHADGGFPLI